MVISYDDAFLPLAALETAEEALRGLRSCTSPTQAIHTSIKAEDTIKSLLSNSVINKAQAERLYLIFEANLEIMLRDLAGKEDGPRRFP
jgi:hypothetical protein